MRLCWGVFGVILGLGLVVSPLTPTPHAAPNADCRFTWIPAVSPDDGTPLTDLAGLHLYAAPTQTGTYIKQGTLTLAQPELALPCTSPSWWKTALVSATQQVSALSSPVPLPRPPALPEPMAVVDWRLFLTVTPDALRLEPVPPTNLRERRERP